MVEKIIGIRSGRPDYTAVVERTAIPTTKLGQKGWIAQASTGVNSEDWATLLDFSYATFMDTETGQSISANRLLIKEIEVSCYDNILLDVYAWLWTPEKDDWELAFDVQFYQNLKISLVGLQVRKTDLFVFQVWNRSSIATHVSMYASGIAEAPFEVIRE